MAKGDYSPLTLSAIERALPTEGGLGLREVAKRIETLAPGSIRTGLWMLLRATAASPSRARWARGVTGG